MGNINPPGEINGGNCPDRFKGKKPIKHEYNGILGISSQVGIGNITYMQYHHNGTDQTDVKQDLIDCLVMIPKYEFEEA
ncbi:hypothetical protein GCM10022216_28490 [Sphingobacterium kyonggiense]|uniref:Uncharacterized protein n=1 Tax=Sphingobacterium kyonggiense TaxID=714075 RepID=A0ABP7Z0P8_9SPHI